MSDIWCHCEHCQGGKADLEISFRRRFVFSPKFLEEIERIKKEGYGKFGVFIWAWSPLTCPSGKRNEFAGDGI